MNAWVKKVYIVSVCCITTKLKKVQLQTMWIQWVVTNGELREGDWLLYNSFKSQESDEN